MNEIKLHGGDIYRNRVQLDFSVNISPLGMPEAVKRALENAVWDCERYPDPQSEELLKALADRTGVAAERLVCTNGASELFCAVLNALRPGQVLIPVPSFFGYERAARAAGCKVVFYEMKEKEGFRLGWDFLAELTDQVDLVFLANPNNPIGNVIERELLFAIAKACRQNGIILVVDECFLAFTKEPEKNSLFSMAEQFPEVILVRAFTKLYAVPGVRLGYGICGDRHMAEKIRRQLPEWNLSVFAQRAGAAACGEKDYAEEARALVLRERDWLREEIRKLGPEVLPSEANFLLLKTELPLYELLLEQGILIRDCANFRGLKSGYYRIAVKRRQENELFVKALKAAAKGSRNAVDLKSERRAPVQAGGIEYVLPDEIEKRSFAILSKELLEQGIVLPRQNEAVIKRVIHTSADFSYAKTMVFSEHAVDTAKQLIRNGADIVTDTNMALAGINKKTLKRYGGTVRCFMAEEETARLAGKNKTTRAVAAVDLAVKIEKPVIFAIGNAPTALLRLHDLFADGRYRPAFVIGVPVGFVNVEAAKELILKTDLSYIINRGRKGGSNVAAAICNAILYELCRE